MSKEQLQIAYDQIPKVLLLGNGINRAYGFASWNSLIESIRTKELSTEEKESIKNIPYPLLPVVLTGDHVGTQMKNISMQLSELDTHPQERELLLCFASLPVDSILTANYTYELEKSINDNFVCLPGRRCRFRKTAYAESSKYSTELLHTYFSFDNHPPIWHIHGEAARHNTMVLGHYYYGKLLSKMQQHMQSLIVRYKSSAAKKQNIEPRSWLDYFMLGDIHIIGLGMSLSEMDLWWLINCKKRNFPDRKVILYKPDIKPEEKLLAEAYGMIVETNGFTGDYQTYL